MLLRDSGCCLLPSAWQQGSTNQERMQQAAAAVAVLFDCKQGLACKAPHIRHPCLCQCMPRSLCVRVMSIGACPSSCWPRQASQFSKLAQAMRPCVLCHVKHRLPVQAALKSMQQGPRYAMSVFARSAVPKKLLLKRRCAFVLAQSVTQTCRSSLQFDFSLKADRQAHVLQLTLTLLCLHLCALPGYLHA